MMKLTIIDGGDFVCDGGALFGVVPKKVWSKRYACDEENFCVLTMRCLLIETEGKRILIETGAGNKQTEYLKYSNIDSNYTVLDGLKKQGIDPLSITDVVLTHLHFDHCGGCTHYEQGVLTISFPNAQHWVGKLQWENYLNPNIREGNSYFPENMMPIEEAGLLRTIAHNEFLCKGVELRLFNGHTRGQIAPYFDFEGKTHLYTGDIIPTAASIPVAWVSAYDTHPETSMSEKMIILKEAVDLGQVLFFEHDKYTECCMVGVRQGKYAMIPMAKD